MKRIALLLVVVLAAGTLVACNKTPAATDVIEEIPTVAVDSNVVATVAAPVDEAAIQPKAGDEVVIGPYRTLKKLRSGDAVKIGEEAKVIPTVMAVALAITAVAALLTLLWAF